MPRLPAFPDDDFPPEADRVRQEVERRLGTVPNLHRTLAHAPDVLAAFVALEQAVQSDLPPRYRELAFLATSRLNGSAYGESRHLELAESAGITKSQLESLEDFESSEDFDDRERAVLRFAEQLARDTSVSDETTAELAEFLDESQRVVLANVVGLAGLADRLAAAFEVEPDEADGE